MNALKTIRGLAVPVVALVLMSSQAFARPTKPVPPGSEYDLTLQAFDNAAFNHTRALYHAVEKAHRHGKPLNLAAARLNAQEIERSINSAMTQFKMLSDGLLPAEHALVKAQIADVREHHVRAMEQTRAVMTELGATPINTERLRRSVESVSHQLRDGARSHRKMLVSLDRPELAEVVIIPEELIFTSVTPAKAPTEKAEHTKSEHAKTEPAKTEHAKAPTKK